MAKKIIKLTKKKLMGTIEECVNRMLNTDGNIPEVVLNEKSLNRIEKYVQENEIAIITAWRNRFVNVTDKTDTPTHIRAQKGKRSEKIDTKVPFEDGEEFTTTEKKYYNKKLQAALLSYGYGVTKVRGRWHEDMSNSSDTDDEESFFVVNLPRKDGSIDEHFKERIFELSEKTNQDAFTYSPMGTTKGYAIGTNNSSWPGYGQSVELGDFMKNITAQAMTLVGNKGFSFVNDDSAYTDSQPNSFQLRKRQRTNSPAGVLETIESYNILSRRLITEDAMKFLSEIGVN